MEEFLEKQEISDYSFSGSFPALGSHSYVHEEGSIEWKEFCRKLTILVLCFSDFILVLESSSYAPDAKELYVCFHDLDSKDMGYPNTLVSVVENRFSILRVSSKILADPWSLSKYEDRFE
uniref:F-box protein n=1 Tax=Steinernema glaseri TaxID=37863 RepID=A0A1I8ABW8_9BILA